MTTRMSFSVAVMILSAWMVQAQTNVPAAASNVVAVAGGTNSHGAVTNVTPAKPEIPAPDPMVGRALMALASCLQPAKRFRCDVSFLVNSEMEGMKQEIHAAYALAVEKPNRLALRYLRGMAGNTVVCDGKTLFTYASALNRYEEHEAPKTLEQFTQGGGALSGNMLFVENLIRDDVYAAVMDGVLKASYVGKANVDGVECEHFKFEQDQFDWELWMTPGPKPVVMQVLSDMSKGLGDMTGEANVPKGMKMTVLNKFSNWSVDGELPADTFEFKPPAGARKTNSLFEGEEEPMDRPVSTEPEDGKSMNAADRK